MIVNITSVGHFSTVENIHSKCGFFYVEKFPDVLGCLQTQLPVPHVQLYGSFLRYAPLPGKICFGGLQCRGGGLELDWKIVGVHTHALIWMETNQLHRCFSREMHHNHIRCILGVRNLFTSEGSIHFCWWWPGLFWWGDIWGIKWGCVFN